MHISQVLTIHLLCFPQIRRYISPRKSGTLESELLPSQNLIVAVRFQFEVPSSSRSPSLQEVAATRAMAAGVRPAAVSHRGIGWPESARQAVAGIREEAEVDCLPEAAPAFDQGLVDSEALAGLLR